MKTFQFLSSNSDQTVAFGCRLAGHFEGGEILCLFGNLGAGKTTLTKGIAAGLGINPKHVNSPSFVLMSEYSGRLALFHFDFYRIQKTQDIISIGYEEFFYDNGVTVVEWPERLGTLLPVEYLHVQLSHREQKVRSIKLMAHGLRYERILGELPS